MNEQRKAEIRERLSKATPERWKPYPGNHDYEISDHGGVRSWRRRGTERDRPEHPRRLTPRGNGNGYLTVSLPTKGCGYVNRLVHGLVMETFVGPRPAGLEIAHLNGDRTDNRVCNLTYITHEENESHKRLHGTHASGETVNGSYLTPWQVSEMRYLGSQGVSQGKIAALFDIGHRYVSDILAGKVWTDVAGRVAPTDLADLLAELDRTTADLAVAAEVARERGREVERLRKVAEAAGEEHDAFVERRDDYDAAHEALAAAVRAWRTGEAGR